MTEKPEAGAAQMFAPEGSTAFTFLVYDPESGDVVHGHKELFLPKADVPGEEELAKIALEHAAQATDRDAGKLRALQVSDEELKPGVAYRVDPDSERLEPLDDGAATA
jgi:hypothetical protein